MPEFREIELTECADERESVERFCRLARAYVIALGWDDVFRVEGRVQGTHTRDLEWTPAEGARGLHTLLTDYREYFEGIWFPRIDAALLGDDLVEATTLHAHGVGLRIVSVRGDARVADRLEALAADVDAGVEPVADAASSDPRLRRMALFTLAWPTSRGDRDNRALAADITAALRAALDDDAPSVRATAAAIAGRYRILALFDDVTRRLGDASAVVRAAAISALRAIDDVATLVHAAPRLCDEDETVRRAALSVMRHAGHLPWARRKEVMGPLGSDLARGWPWLTAAERREALDWLAGTPHANALHAIEAARSDDDVTVRCKAVEVAACLECDGALESVVRFIEDSDEEVQAAALEALSQEDLRARLQADGAMRSAVMTHLARLAQADESGRAEASDET